MVPALDEKAGGLAMIAGFLVRPAALGLIIVMLVAIAGSTGLIDRVLEVHREPARPGPARRHWGYVAIATLGGDATITPLAAPSAGIRVADLLP